MKVPLVRESSEVQRSQIKPRFTALWCEDWGLAAEARELGITVAQSPELDGVATHVPGVTARGPGIHFYAKQAPAIVTILRDLGLTHDQSHGLHSQGSFTNSRQCLSAHTASKRKLGQQHCSNTHTEES